MAIGGDLLRSGGIESGGGGGGELAETGGGVIGGEGFVERGAALDARGRSVAGVDVAQARLQIDKGRGARRGDLLRLGNHHGGGRGR